MKYGNKVIFPNFANKLTSTIVISGLGLIVTPAPIKVVFFNWLIDVFNLNSGVPVTLPDVSSGTADFTYGLTLVAIGLVFNLIRYWFEFKTNERESAVKLEHRKKLLSDVRKALSVDGLTNRQFRKSTEYAQIKKYLSADTIKAVEGEHTKGPGSSEIIRIVVGEARGSGVNPFKNSVLDELADIEIEWNLI
ncbi:hypothetical protein [Photobacterium swingsii]|nr:hypothetical protein [Photobacterium swingsii]